MPQNFTVSLIQQQKPKEKPYEIRDGKTLGLLLRVQPTGKKTYICVFKVNGKKSRKSLGDASAMRISEARAVTREILTTAHQGVHPAQKNPEEDAGTLGGYIELLYKPYAERNIISHVDILTRLKRNFGHLYNKPLMKLNEADIEKWRTNKTTKFQTTKKELDYLKSVFNIAITKHKVISHHPLAHYKLEADLIDIQDMEVQKPRFLTEAEETVLRAALIDRETNIREERDNANQWREKRGIELLSNLKPERYADHIQPITLLALLTGLHRSDLFTLEWEHVDLNNQQLTKVINKTRRKKPKAISLDICTEAAIVLRQWRASSNNTGLVFPSPVTGKPLDNIDKAFKRLLKTAEIETFTFHDLRHTFACRLVAGGIDLYTVQKLMTHSDPKMTQRYAYLSPDHMKAALDKVFNRFGPAGKPTQPSTMNQQEFNYD